MTVQSPIRVAIAGLGRAGTFHLERLSLREDFQVIAVCDNAPMMPAYNATLVSGGVTDWRSILCDPGVDVVLIATPPRTHVELALDALAAGKHVLVEQPIALKVADIDRLISASTQAQGSLKIVQTRQWDDDFRTALEVARGGRLGSLKAVKLIVWDTGVPASASSETATHWSGDSRTGGGVLIEFGTHYLPQLLQLVDETPQSVFAQFNQVGRNDRTAESQFSMLVTFPSGATAQIEVDMESPIRWHTGWTLTGTLGGFQNFRRYQRTEDGEIFDSPVDISPFELDGAYAELATSIRMSGRIDPGVDPQLQRARTAVQLIEAARESAQSQRTISVADIPATAGGDV